MKQNFVSHVYELVCINRWHIKYTILLVLLMSIMLPVQLVKAEDLMQVYRLAKENDPAFQGEIYRHEASPETSKQAYSEVLPKVTIDAFNQRTRQQILDTDVAVYGEDLVRYPSRGYILTLTQPIFRASSFTRISQAKEEVRRDDLKFEAAKQDLTLRVAEAYIKALEAHDALEFTHTEEEALRLHFELAQERYNSGLAPITDFHDAKARLVSVTAQRVMSENSLDDALEALAEVTGQRIENLARLKFAPITGGFFTQDINESTQGIMPLVSPDPDDINDWLDAALKQNFGVQVQRQEVLVADQEIKRQMGGHWPTLTFVGRLNRDQQGGSLFGGESDLQTREAILQLNFPLFQGFSVLSKTREARELLKAVKQDLEKETRAVKRETRAAFLGVKSAIKSTEALKQSVVSNQIALGAKIEGFKSGLFPSLAVIDTERDLHQAKMKHAKAKYDYIYNSLRLKKAVGTLNEEDLAGINQWLE
ncbi:MAG: TolC family outer membrane protein [Deltaproteobacteria bacterium]|nr:TolC family outer membrane protein [Deltaproteobacteria bacterium]